jgi:hypothetical protein
MKASRCISLSTVALAMVATVAFAQTTGSPAKSATPAKAAAPASAATTTKAAAPTSATKAAAPASATAPAKSSTHTSTAPAGSSTHATSTAPASEDHLAAIEQNLQQSRHNLKSYHWKETTVVSSQGEDKAPVVNSCAFDAAGKLIRTPEGAPSTMKAGMSGKPADTKKDELKAYMHSAVALMRGYVPPDPVKLQKCKTAGKMSETVEEGGRVKIVFKDYEKPGDDMTVEVNTQTNQILSLDVASYLQTAKDAVKLNAEMASLPDGTNYPSRVRLDTPAKAMGVTVTNSDYQKKATS